MNHVLRLDRFGESLRTCSRVVDEPVPTPGPGQVLIRHSYVGVNGLFDEVVARGQLAYRNVVPPCDLGVEAVGTVVEVGEGVTALNAGDPVATSRFGGGYREWLAIDAADAVVVPAATPEYVALRTSAVSAMLALERAGELRRDEVVLITAAAGGLGQFLVQLARLAGNHVIGVCSGPEKAALLRRLGCDRPVDRTTEDLEEVLAREYPQGVDLAVDSVGGTLFDTIVAHLGNGGRLVVVGYASDLRGDGPEPVHRPRVYADLYWKAASVRAFQNAFFAADHRPAFDRLLRLYADGQLTIALDPARFCGVESIVDAVDHLVSGASIGKVVVDVRPTSGEQRDA
jgi:NADPH:quinone reductase-like Zn-dependent oxidoreductase